MMFKNRNLKSSNVSFRFIGGPKLSFLLAPAMLDSHLTPPTSDHQSGGEDSERSELTSLTERLNKTRELTRVINMKLESTGHVSIIRSLKNDDVFDLFILGK